jgi:PAS domain S-box-containing protein
MQGNGGAVDKELPLGFWSIGRKMLLLLLIIFLPASAIIVVSSLTHGGRAIQDEANKATLLVQSLAARHEQITAGTKQMLGTLARLPELQKRDVPACSELFRQLRKSFPFYAFLGAVTPDGEIFASSPPIKDKVSLGDRKYVKDAIRTQGLSVGEYHIGKVSRVSCLSYAYPVFDAEGSLAAIVIAGFDVGEFSHFLTGLSLPNGSSFTVTDRKGIRLFRFPENDAVLPGEPTSEGAFMRMNGGPELGTFRRTGEDGVYRTYAFKQVRLQEGSSPYLYLKVGTASNRILEAAGLEMFGYLSVLGILGLLAMYLVWRHANHLLIQPVNQLVKTTQRFGKGEMWARTGLPHSTNEIGLLAKSFDDMASLLEMRDIERKKAGEALRASEEMFRLLVENAPDAIFVQTEGLFAYVNPAAVKLLGAKSPHQLIRRSNMERLHPDYREEVGRRIHLLSIEKKPVPNIELKFIRIDGSVVEVETSAVPITYNGQDGALVFVRDISERKRAKEEHEHLNRLNRLILGAASEGIIGLDVQGKAVFSNPSSAVMLGYEIEQMLGKDMHQLIHHSKPDGSVYPRNACPMHATLRTGNPCPMREEVLWRKNGEKFPALYSCTPIIEAGNIIGAVLTIRDITEHKKDEEIRSMLEAKLSQAQKFEAIATLAGGIAHDFNNILAPIIGFTEMALNDSSLPGQIRNGLEQVFNAGLRAKDLVRQILTFSRPDEETGRRPLEISLIVKEVLKLLRASLPAAIEIKQNLEKGRVLADATQIHQVLMNLCVNATHAMDDNGVLEVNLFRVDLSEDDLESLSLIGLKPGPFLRLSVSDTGCGMDTATMPRIFEPYFTTKDFGKGTGLGLAVVHGIVKRHDGAISVKSAPGKGTTFTIYLPCLKAAALTVDGPVHDLEKGNENILFIDDEQIMLEIGTQILSRLGYQVTSVTDGLKALELFRADADHFDLVITDCSMSKLTGTEFAKEIHRIRPGIPVIICTGFSEKTTLSTAVDFDVEIIVKPFVAKDLANMVRKALDKDRSKQSSKPGDPVPG